MSDKIINLICIAESWTIAAANFLSGKKAYIVGIAMMIVGYSHNDNKLILEGLSVITLRAGIEKSKPNY